MALKSGKVIGRFLASVIDGIDSDSEPDLVPLSGSVTFTPAVNKVLTTDTNPPTSVFPVEIKATLDSEGYITHRFERGVRLLSPATGVNPSGWTWRVTLDLAQGGTKISTTSFDIEVPAYVAGPDTQNPDVGSTAIDLALVAPIPSFTGTPIVRGEQGDSISAIALNEAGTSMIISIDRSTGMEQNELDISQLAGRIGSKIFLDTDGVPYFDPANEYPGIALGQDTDGTPYILGEI